MIASRLIPIVLIAALASADAARSQEYVSAEAAYQFALAHFANRQPEKGHAALMAALKLMPDAGLKGRIFRSILSSAAQPVPVEKTLQAAEYVIENPSSPAERSIHRSHLAGHLRLTGKTREAIYYFEKKLVEKPDDFISLYILADLDHRVEPNPEKMIKVSETLLASKMKLGSDVEESRFAAALAENYVIAKRFADGAALYEKIAPLDSTTTAWHLKEAALAWFKADDKTRARAAAIASSTCKIPERRADSLTHYWHRHLGELFAKMGDYGSAAEHLEKAIASTNIDGYRRDCQARLKEVKEKLAR